MLGIVTSAQEDPLPKLCHLKRLSILMASLHLWTQVDIAILRITKSNIFDELQTQTGISKS
jgi:hypothetical protein